MAIGPAIRGPATQPSFDDLGATLFDTTFVVVDLETTGLSPAVDRITEIGAVKVRAGDRLGEFHSLVHPGMAIPPQVTALTGITPAMVAGAPPIEALLPAWLEFARDAVLVAHNANFDVGFLQAELQRHGYPPFDNIVVDTARLARRAFRDEVRDTRLATLARHVRSRTVPDHRALHDARATVDVLHGIMERLGTLGVNTLEDLRDYARSKSDPLFRKVDLVREAPRSPGVYRFVDDRGEVLYVGKATDLRSRLRTYFGQDGRRRIADMVRLTDRVEWTRTPTELEASVREVRSIQAHRPRFNRRSRFPERAVYVKLTAERFPRLSIVSKLSDDGALYLGPIGSKRTATAFLEAVYDALPIRQCTGRLRVAQDHPACVLKELGRCGAPCDGTQSPEQYAGVVDAFRAAVSDDASHLLGPLRSRMLALAGQGRFEDASRVRGRLHRVANLLADTRRVRHLVAVPRLLAARDVGDATEVALVSHGRLVATERFPDGVPAVESLLLLLESSRPPGEPPQGLPSRLEVEEVRLVAGWLDDAAVRVLHVDGSYAEPVIGGAALRGATQEARRVARAVRRDLQRLRGDKVVRRAS